VAIGRTVAFLAVAHRRRGCKTAAMTSPVTVRPAEAADEAALGRLGALLVAEHHEFDPKRFIAPRPETPQAYGHFLVSHLGSKDRSVLVAEQDGAVIGYVFFGMEGIDYMALRGPAGAIYDLVVDPGHRRQGVGGTLMDAALAELAERGAPRAVLSTAEKNHGAHRLFAGAGFRRTMIEMTREL
jgi:ribosomal protein S18 acetylase RimI-like enzyme